MTRCPGRSQILALAAWLSWSAGGNEVVRAEPPRAFVEAFVPSARLLREQRERQLARGLERLLGTGARVAVVLPDPAAHSLDEALPPVSVIVAADGEGQWLEDDVRRVLKGLDPELGSARLTLLRRTAQPQPEHVSPREVRVGPFRVAESSALPLKGALTVLLAAIAGLSAALIYAARRTLRRSRR